MHVDDSWSWKTRRLPTGELKAYPVPGRCHAATTSPARGARVESLLAKMAAQQKAWSPVTRAGGRVLRSRATTMRQREHAERIAADDIAGNSIVAKARRLLEQAERMRATS